MTELDLAKKERSLWDRLRDDFPKKAPMVDILANKTGAPTDRIRQRSNLLKLGLKIPGILHLWEKVDHNEITLVAAYQEAKSKKIRKTKPARVKKARPKPRPKKAQRPPTPPPKPTVTPLQEVTSELELLLLKLKNLGVVEVPRVEPLHAPHVENEVVRGVILETRNFIYAELEKAKYLDADKSRLASVTQRFLVALDDDLGVLGRAFSRMHGVKPRFAMKNSVGKALGTLGFPTDTDIVSDYQEIKKKARQLRRDLHPDRTNQPATPEFFQINDAMVLLEDHYHRLTT